MAPPRHFPRVLFITPQPFFQWRGSPIRVSFNLQALSELGYTVDVLTLPFGEDRAYPNVRLIRVGNVAGRTNIPIGPSVWKLPFGAKLWWRARQLIDAQPYHIIHAVEDAGPPAVSLARRSRARFIFEKHSDPGSYRKGTLRNTVLRAYAMAEAYAIRHADAVIGTGPGLVRQAQRIAPETPCHHIFDIPSSLAQPDAARADALRQSWCPTGQEVISLYVGSFAVYQGIELLFSAIPQVCARDARARFVIIGGTPEEIKARRTQLGAWAERVEFLGMIAPDQLPDYLAAAHLLISSRIAGTNTPLKLLDYLKAGRCIIATDHEANRQILDDTTAFFVSPTATGLAQGIGTLVTDTAQRERIAEKGRVLAQNSYSYTAFKEKLHEVYKPLCNETCDG